MPEGKRFLNLFFSKNIFCGSFNDLSTLPDNHLPECCLIGRSNVGKSSLINAIAHSQKLAKTSKKPGRTQSINIYEFDKRLNIVDLPGYGYGKFSFNQRENLSNLLKTYLMYRNNLKMIYILIDCKVGIKNIDIDIFDLMDEINKKFKLIFNKIDICSKKYVNSQIESIESFLINYPKFHNKILVSSSKNYEGIVDIQKDIYNLESSK